MHEDLWIRWYMVVFFAVFGLRLLLKRKRFASAGPFFCSLCLDEPLHRRLVLAYQSRERSEDLPSTSMGILLGTLSLITALIAALTHVPVVLLYAVNVIALATVLTFAYMRLRKVAIRRVATLQVRDPNRVIPWYAWSLVLIAVVLPLLWVPVAPVASSVITAAGIAVATLARRVASMPALLSGDDIIVETFVDVRLRRLRALNLLATAVAPGFVFEAFTGYTDSVTHVVAMQFALLVLVAMIAMQVSLLRRRPSQAETLTWIHAAP